MGTRNRFNVCLPCCTDNSPCDKCSSQDTTRTVTFDGFTFNCCQYGDEPPVNTAYTLVQPSPLNRPCHYIRYAPSYWCQTYGGNRLGNWMSLDAVELDNGNYGWRCVLYITMWSQPYAEYRCSSQTTLVFEWDSGAAAQFDCTAPRSLTLTDIIYYDAYPTPYGNLASVTCELS